ncbi:MAG: zinc-dependent peptidase [Clostridiales bacterium]|nr:zinc-dependent peptidase [Clostridiales bacterium]
MKSYDEKYVINKIEGANNITELEQIVMSNDICDYCSFAGLHLEVAKILICGATRVLYLFPRIRSRMCFLGSVSGYRNTMRSLCLLDRDIIEKFKIRDICSDDTIINLASRTLIFIDNTEYDNSDANITAEAYPVHGIFDAVVLDEGDFKGLAYRRLLNSLKYSHATGHHPVGCDSVISTVYHEFGHLLDFLIKLSDNEEFLSYYNSFTKEQIEKNLSKYAATNAKEFFAEAFSEYMSNKKPRSIATYLWNLLEKLYQEKYKKGEK